MRLRVEPNAVRLHRGVLIGPHRDNKNTGAPMKKLRYNESRKTERKKRSEGLNNGEMRSAGKGKVHKMERIKPKIHRVL